MNLRNLLGALALLVILFSTSICRAEEPAAPEAKDTLPLLASMLETEPLAFIAIRDVRTMSEKYSATLLAKMIADQSFDKGALTLEGKIIDALGISIRNEWPKLEKNFSGPVILAVLPGKAAAETAPISPDLPAPAPTVPLRLVILALVPVPEVGTALQQAWPKPLSPGSIIAAAPLKTVAIAELPTPEKIPAWVALAPWPKGDMIVRVDPIRLCEAARPLIRSQRAPIDLLAIDVAPLIASIEGSGIDVVTWALTFKDEIFSEQLLLDINENDSSFKRFAATIKEKPGSWGALMAATPGEQDAAVMMQSDPSALGNDLPYVFQAIERWMRGKKWSVIEGNKPEAYDPTRFKFLYERMQGLFSIVARPSISGDLRMIIASSVKGTDVETYRGELIAGLEKIDSGFETFGGARKIGGASPLGPIFQGHGKFASPVIGLSQGWNWLCSSSAAYLELTDALKGERMMSDRGKKKAPKAAPKPKSPLQKQIAEDKAAANPPAAATDNADGGSKLPPPPATYWKPSDSWRVEVNLERVFKIAYAAWLLSSNEGPQIGTWKVPSDLVPSPQVFARNLGYLQAAASRQDRRMECRSQCVFPGMTLAILAGLQEGADAVALSKRKAQDVNAQVEAREAAEKALEAEKERRKNAAKDKGKKKPTAKDNGGLTPETK